MSDLLKDTLNLPKTEFPMRAGLVEREPKRVEYWEESELYEAIQEGNKEGEKFVLHDGPPFTNAGIHIGTGLNKILKDVILRYKSLRGYRTPYVPGWDCHGLPIEHKVSEEMRKKKEKLEVPELRRRCEAFARKYMGVQREQFKRLGVMGDWDKEYMSLDSGYEAEVIRVFAGFVEKGLVYRSKKPVYWSIPCGTALAEAEIEYKDHVSPSIYVKFPFVDGGKLGIEAKEVYVVIWTTTPWTLPSNMGIAVHPRLNYQEVEHEGKVYLVAEELAEDFIEKVKLEGAKRGKVHLGEGLEHMECRHPFIDRPSLIVLGDHVTTESGTGCVHTAPGHGPDDYLVALKYNLEVYCPLNDYGKYIDDGRVPERLVNKTVLTKNGRCPANEVVLEILNEVGMLLSHTDYEHSYPHCWRSKTPVIFRAMDQWFVGVDREGMRDKALEAIDEVEWIPGWGKNRIRGSVEMRPDWCISRQRAWGIPIVAFYDEHGNPLLDGKVIRAVADRVEKEGSNIWFEKTAEELLEGVELPKDFCGIELKKGTDTLDVWINSGSSHEAVLKKHSDLAWPADVYFEGSDQHRGWFQSSLWTSIILNGKAPYKRVITHGFVVDENKRKISKSDKSTKTIEEYVEKYGADILRLWISSEEYRNDIPISDGILKHIVQTYRTIRNTLKFQLGNLYDFDIERDGVRVQEMPVIDRWALHKLSEFMVEVEAGYEAYEFHKVYQLLNRFCSVTLSATYHDILKDRLYTYAPDWKERRASQTVIYYIFEALVKILSPILTFTADEAWGYFREGREYSEGSVHCEGWPEVREGWEDKELLEEVEKLFEVRDLVNEQLERLRQEKVLGQSLDARVEIIGDESGAVYGVLKKYEGELAEFFIVSQVELRGVGNKKLDVLVKQAEGVRCPRSWRWVKELVNHEEFGEVSPRCRDALLDKYPEKVEG